MASRTYSASIEAEGPHARSVWVDLLAQDPTIGLSRTAEWLDCICASGHFSDATLLLRGADGRRFVLPRVRKGGVAAHAKLFESPPREWDLGAAESGFIGEGGRPSPEVTQALIEAVRPHSGFRTRVVVGGDDAKAWSVAAPTTTFYTPRTAQVLDLDGGFPAVWSHRFTSKVRSNIRKAEKRGVVVECDNTPRLIDAFDGLYRASVDRWAQESGLPLSLMRSVAMRRNPPAKYALVADRMGQRCRVWVAWRNGEPIAGLIVLTAGPWATYWRGAMHKERARGTGANEYLHSCAIEASISTGQRHYDFGLHSTEDLRRFKATFGAVEVPVRNYYLEMLPTAAAQSRCVGTAKHAVRAVADLARRHR
jgi:hypothetical protein